MGFPAHIVGNMTADPELRYTQNGLAVAGFSIAVNDRKFNRQTNEWEDGETTFVRCSVWREMAEYVTQSLTKGTRVMVSGKVELKEFETRDGAKGSSLEMTVDDIGPSLKYATAQVLRAVKPQGGAPGGPQGGPPAGYGQQTPARGGQTPPRGPAQPQQEQWHQPGPATGQPGPQSDQQWATPAYQGEDVPF